MLPLKTRRNATDHPHALVAGESEADEPLFVKQSRRLLQQRHPPAVVFNQVVVGCESISNSVLNRQPRQQYREVWKSLQWYPRSEEHTSELQSLRHLVC